MSNVEKMRVLVLFGVMSVVFVSASWTLGGSMARIITRAPAPQRDGLSRWARRAVLVLAAAAVGCVAWGYFVEPYWLEQTHVSVRCGRLPAGSRPIRIVHISDLHTEAKVRLEEKLVVAIEKMRPDAIVFTGDALISRAGKDNLQRCMKALAAIAPTYAVLGNWDVNQMAAVDLYEGTGVRVLRGEAARLWIDGTEVYFVGGSTRQWAQTEQALRSLPAAGVRVVLYHYPRQIYEAAAAGADLYVAGHIHGGQIALPFYGAVITMSPFGKRFEHGLYSVKDTWMYVSRGVGLEGGIVPRVRFCARPEVTLIELTAKP